MPMFRKKPVVIEAVQVGPYPAPQWFSDAMQDGRITPGGDAGVFIQTLEGVMTASPNDWVIQGVKGEIYPCKPDIFAATYEPAEPIQMPELTPEQQKAFEEEWSKPESGHITYRPMGTGIRDHDVIGSWAGGEIVDGDTISVDHLARGKAWIEGRDPGPAIGEHLTDIDADELPEDILARIRYDAALLVGRIAHLEAQLQAEGEHTEAANAEIERLKQSSHTTERIDPTSHPD